MNREKLLKNAKPILFNTEMVQAILEGRKTVTRRLINPRYREDEYGFFVVTCEATGKRWVEKYNEDEGDFEQTRYVNPPYQVGDILYVRETFCYDDFDNGGETVYYRANYNEREAKDLFTDCDLHWKPSIHMPKEAARIFLKVTDVRVERLQGITTEGIEKEGTNIYKPFELCTYDETRYAFETLWNSTIKKQDIDKYGWEANPWGWVIEFEKIKALTELEDFLMYDKNFEDLLYCKKYPTDSVYDFIFDTLDTIKKLLSLPTRTIETLEVGDYVEFMDMDGEKQSVIIQIGEALGYLNMYFNHCRATKIKIIPHEAIKLLKELIE